MVMARTNVWRAAVGAGAGALCLAGLGCASAGRESAAVPAAPAAAADAVPAAAAATNAPPADGYAWEELARLAAANCSEAKALLLEAQAERHQAAVDTGWRNPQLRAGRHWGDEDEHTPGRGGMRTYPQEVGSPSRPFLRGREWSDTDFEGDTLGLRVYTANPFVNRWLRRRGEASAKAREEESRQEAYAVFCEVRTLCLEAELLREEIGLLERMAGLRNQLRDVRNEQADAGVTSPLDLIRAETRLASLRAEIRAKQAERQQLVRRIAVLAGIPVAQVKLAPRKPGPPVAEAYQDPAVLTDLAFLRRPDLAQAEREKEAAEHGVRAARAGQVPWFEYVEGTVEDETAHADSYEQYYTGHDRTTSDQTEWQVRVALTVPVFNWLGDEVRLSRAQLAAAETRVRGLYDTVRAEVGGVLDDYRSAHAERERLVGECDRLCAAMSARIDALEKEPAVKREEVLAAREELVAYRRMCLQAERESLVMAQYLETVCGGSLGPEQAK